MAKEISWSLHHNLSYFGRFPFQFSAQFSSLTEVKRTFITSLRSVFITDTHHKPDL